MHGIGLRANTEYANSPMTKQMSALWQLTQGAALVEPVNQRENVNAYG
jgi:hypothetical protein